MTGSTTPAFGFNIIGYVSSNLGMGVTARHFIRLLRERGYPVAVLDIDSGLGRGGHDRTYANLTVAHARELPYAVNLFLFSILALPEFFLKPADGLLREDRINVGLVWWELTVLPDRLVEALRLFDVVLAGSEFVQHVIEFNVPGVRIVLAKHPVYLPNETVVGKRSQFGLPEEPVLFLSSFEPVSGPQRKNPFAAVAAFQQAFPDKSDGRAKLVIKLNNADKPSNSLPRLLEERLRQQCDHDPRLLVLTESLSYAEVLQLYASCDVFVSLHRSEGLGLGPLEAMRLGRPVIATGWSGNLSYMNFSNACLISYRFIPAQGDAHYSAKFLGKTGFWAEPDITEAAQWMKSLVENPELRAAFAKRALESTTAYQKDAEKGQFVDEIRAIWEQRKLIPGVFAPRYANVKALREAKYAFDLSLLTLRKRILAKIRATLYRHFLWRFK